MPVKCLIKCLQSKKTPRIQFSFGRVQFCENWKDLKPSVLEVKQSEKSANYALETR
jgi:hypothetical protein